MCQLKVILLIYSKEQTYQGPQIRLKQRTSTAPQHRHRLLPATMRDFLVFSGFLLDFLNLIRPILRGHTTLNLVTINK